MEIQVKHIDVEEKGIHQMKFFDTGSLFVADSPDEKGAYIAKFKVSAIPQKPEDEYEREKRFKQALDGVYEVASKIKASLEGLNP